MESGKRKKIEELVWYEMGHAKYWEQYLSEYIGKKIDWRKYINIATIILSVTGASTWEFWSFSGTRDWAPMVILLLIAALQLLSALQKEIVVDNETLHSLAKLRALYIAYFNKLECLFIQNEAGSISVQEVEDRYFALRETVYPIEELKDFINIPELKNVKEKGEKEAYKYLQTRYGVSYGNNSKT